MSGRVWLGLAGVALGIAAGSILELPLIVGASSLSSLSLALRRHPKLAATATLTLSLCAGWTAAALHRSDGAELRAAALVYPRCTISGRVLEQAGALGTLVALEASDCSPSGEGAVVMSALELSSGTRFDSFGWLRPLDDEGFDAMRARLGADAEFVARYIRPHRVAGFGHVAARTFRDAMSNAARDLHPERRGIVLGMTIGDTSALPEHTMEDLRRAGLAHLLAVSGSNVVIVLGSVALSLRRLSLNVRMCGSAIALAFYVVVVGPDPSVLRAGAMAAIAIVAMWRGRPTRSLPLLGLALLVLLLMRPPLLYSAGLHLSAAATFGIVLWAAPLAKRFARLPSPVALALGATLAAQFAVSPVLVATFGEVSLIAPLANVLTFPVVAPVTVVGLAAGALAVAWPPGGTFLLELVTPLAGWIVEVGTRTGGAGWAAVEVPAWCAVPVAGVVGVTAGLSLRRHTAPVDVPSRDDAGMADWRWRLHDPEGTDIRETEEFQSKEEAEAWMGAEWQSLLDEGAETVSLTQGGVIVYTMGLKDE